MRRLRLRHIELLDALGKLPTMHAAAQHMNLSQPAVSKMLREIEEAFDERLFDRSRSGVVPSAAGLVAIRWAQVMSNEVSVAAEEIVLTRGGIGQLLSVGSLSVTSILPAAIATMRRTVPGIVIQLREGPVDILVERLLAGEIDCVVGALAPRLLGGNELKNVVVKTVADDSVCVVASSRNRFAKSKRLSWSDVAAEDWVLPPKVTMVRQAFIANYMQRSLSVPEAAVETLSPVTLSALVRTDSSLLGLMRLEQLRAETTSTSLSKLAVGPTILLPPLSMFSRRVRSASPLIDRFFEALVSAKTK